MPTSIYADGDWNYPDQEKEVLDLEEIKRKKNKTYYEDYLQKICEKALK